MKKLFVLSMNEAAGTGKQADRFPETLKRLDMEYVIPDLWERKGEETIMIKLKIVSPMPDMLGLAFSGHTFRKEIEYQLGMTAGNIMDILAEENPGFRGLWRKKTCVQRFMETCCLL